MNRILKKLAVAALPMSLAAGCSDFLTGGELDTDPNRPLEPGSPNQLFVATQSAYWFNSTSEAVRAISMWMQQMAGTDRQYQSLALYDYVESEFDTPWIYVYGGGGLVDARKLQTLVAADKLYLGVAQLLEAMHLGHAADWWGDVPYAEAFTDQITPKLDPQLEVYAALQAQIDKAIVNISGGGQGPGAADLSYGGNSARWLALAHTLKARYYLHVAERDASAYAKAKAEAALGISSAAGTYSAVFSGSAGEENPWHQFVVRERTGYIKTGSTLVDTMKARNDPRLSSYFALNDRGVYQGAPQGAAFGPQFSDLSVGRRASGFDQPLVSFEENLLIWAEAAYRTGDEATALQKLNQERALYGIAPVVAAGPELLRQIMTEKYIALFQNAEVWSDWKRTCLPALTPAAGFSIIPARFYYPTSERQTNPNVPVLSGQPLRNPNDPANPGCDSQN
ncbi:MAG TPA: SusD/RagB family nutrient-binding outer membrane lipoprotein [Gemmatimonadaceae bacterium]|nr:SusD/RagB family nutrient-binding outer membrane lipoprotein [Gemmatimonadaceae bacterium]